MPYQNLTLPTTLNRPFFYTSFAATVDGKVYINKNGPPAGRQGYWPIGSRIDYDTFTRLRAYSDAIIDGKQTAIRFGKNTIDTIHNEAFKKQRESIGKKGSARYIVLTKHPDDNLHSALKNSYNFEPIIFKEDLQKLVFYLEKEGLRHVFVDGGPHVIASLLREKLLDELFITIAPRIFGNEDNLAITMVEGILLEPNEVKLELVSMEQVENEVFLHYKILYS